MMACRACGHAGPTRGIDDGKFLLSVCSACGFGIGLTANAGASHDSGLSQVNVPSGPHTAAYQLSPTGPQKILEDPSVPGDVEDTETVAQSHDGTIILCTADDALNEVFSTWCASHGQGQLDRVMTGQDMVRHITQRIEEFDDTTLCVLDERMDEFPAVELGFAIRAIEAAFDRSRTQLAILGQDSSATHEACKRLGNTTLISLDEVNHVDGPARILEALRESSQGVTSS